MGRVRSGLMILLVILMVIGRSKYTFARWLVYDTIDQYWQKNHYHRFK
jgi:hypothetical protein